MTFGYVQQRQGRKIREIICFRVPLLVSQCRSRRIVLIVKALYLLCNKNLMENPPSLSPDWIDNTLRGGRGRGCNLYVRLKNYWIAHSLQANDIRRSNVYATTRVRLFDLVAPLVLMLCTRKSNETLYGHISDNIFVLLNNPTIEVFMIENIKDFNLTCILI